jgi:PEP-CTERM/exosortase A-associated glycosyltransferase
MRILHILDHSLPLHSGYTFRTRSILREQHALGWETVHLTSPKHIAPGPVEEHVDGLLFHRTPPTGNLASRLPVIGYLDLMAALKRRIRELALRYRPDILHAHSPVLNALPAISVGRELGLPVVYEVRAFWEDAAADHGTSREGGPRYRLTRAVETRALRRADAVTVICEGLRRDIAARGIPGEKITVIPNAVEPEAFAARGSRDEQLAHTLRLDGARVLGFIGSFYAYEGLPLLLQALPEVLARVPQTRVLLVGGGPDEARLRSLAAELRLVDKVVFTGRVPHAEVSRYYDLVDVLVYPRYSMRLTDLVTPLKPLEAMAGSRVVVASDVGGHRELIRNGETGVLFRAGDARSLADAVCRVLGDADLVRRLGEGGRAFVTGERTWAHSVARYRDVYARAQQTVRDRKGTIG